MSETAKATPNPINQFPIRRTNPNNVQPEFVNDLIIGSDGIQLYLTFSQVKPPLAVSIEEIQKIGGLDGIVKTIFVISPQFAEVMSDALSKGIKNYKEAIAKQQEAQQHGN